MLGLLIGAVALAGCARVETPPPDVQVVPSPETIDALFDINGIYDDAHGGTLTISDAGELTFAFELMIVREPLSLTGTLTGVAQITGETAIFTDTNEGAFVDGNPAQLTFTLAGDWIEVKGEHTRYYHDARISFDGSYERVE